MLVRIGNEVQEVLRSAEPLSDVARVLQPMTGCVGEGTEA